MRATHFELLLKILGNNSETLKKYYNNIELLDRDTNTPLDEVVFDNIFPPYICSEIFGTPGIDRSKRMQRKMDLAVLRHTYHLWEDKNYFDITSTLCNKLIYTDLKDIDTFFLRTPYRSMYLSLPKGNGFQVYNVQTGLHEVQSIYLVMNDYGGPNTLKLKTSGDNIDGVTKYMHMLVCGEPKKMFGDAVMFFDLIFWEGKVSVSIDRNKELLNNPIYWEYVVDIFNFVVKTLLYINCSNVVIRHEAGLDIDLKLNSLKNPAKKRKLLQKYEKMSPQAHSVLDVVISNSTEQGQSKSACVSKSTGPKKLERVRGHFKTQHYGVGLSKSKILWVEPYTRGEGAEFYKDRSSYKVN